MRLATVLSIGILLVAAPTMADSGEKRAAGIREINTEQNISAQRKKRLLSAFLFLKLVPPKGAAVSQNTLSLTDFDHTFASAYKMKAVKNIYKKYGFNDNVKLRLRKFSDRNYGFQKRLELSAHYVNQVSGIFAEKGLPPELAWLPLVESGFDPRAYSHKSAAGIWQFMPRTAKKLGLKIDSWVDERRDPVKSTEAAARYLQYLYDRFGSWPLALAAYNAGEGRVKSALEKVGEDDFWALSETQHIYKETREYVPSYIAAVAIATHPEGFGLRRIDYRKQQKFDEVVVTRPMDFDVIAGLAGVSAADIRDLNPELRRWCTPPNVLSYKLKIPEGTGDRFLANMARIRGDELDLAAFYTVRKGDTVEKIANKIGSSIQDIVDRNGLGRRAVIMAGKKILVPVQTRWDQLFEQLMR